MGALSRFMGAGRPGSAGPRAAFAAPGLRARCAGDESHDERCMDFAWLRCKLSGRAADHPPSCLEFQLPSLRARSPAAEDDAEVAAVDEAGAVDVGVERTAPLSAPLAEDSGKVDSVNHSVARNIAGARRA